MSPTPKTPNHPETPAEPGSKPLKNANWEKFAHRISWGVGQAKAYEIAGYPKAESNASNASKLAKNPKVAERVEWLKLQAAQRHVYDQQRIKERLAYMADALSEIRVDPDTGDRRPGPMFNAQAAARVLELLGREQGIFKDRVELGGNVQVANAEVFRRMTPSERAFFKEMLVNAAQRAPVPANDDAPADNAEPEVPAIGVVPSTK